MTERRCDRGQDRVPRDPASHLRPRDLIPRGLYSAAHIVVGDALSCQRAAKRAAHLREVNLGLIQPDEHDGEVVVRRNGMYCGLSVAHRSSL